MDMDYKIKETMITIPLSKDTKNCNIEGILTIPKDSKGLVIFAHGSGSGRHSPRNQYVAKVLNNDGVSTFLLNISHRRRRKNRCLNKGISI